MPVSYLLITIALTSVIALVNVITGQPFSYYSDFSRFFLIFLVDGTLVSGFSTAISIVFLAKVVRIFPDFSTAFSAYGVWIVGSIISSIVAGILFVNVASLTIYHLLLVSCAKTTYESQTNCCYSTPYSTSVPGNCVRSFCPPDYTALAQVIKDEGEID